MKKEKMLHRDQIVSEMVEEVLVRQAKSLVERTGQPFERMLGSSPIPKLASSLGGWPTGSITMRRLRSGRRRCTSAQSGDLLWND